MSRRFRNKIVEKEEVESLCNITKIYTCFELYGLIKYENTETHLMMRFQS